VVRVLEGSPVVDLGQAKALQDQVVPMVKAHPRPNLASSNDSPQGGGSAGGSSSNGAFSSNQRPPQTVNPSGDLLNGGAESTQSPSQQHASTPDATIFDDILVSIAASQVVIGGETFPTGATPTTLSHRRQTFSSTHLKSSHQG
jgi:hypothetical protein